MVVVLSSGQDFTQASVCTASRLRLQSVDSSPLRLPNTGESLPRQALFLWIVHMSAGTTVFGQVSTNRRKSINKQVEAQRVVRHG